MDDQKREEDSCCICLNQLKSEKATKETIVRTECDHLFHENCMTSWMKMGNSSTCPLCRYRLVVLPTIDYKAIERQRNNLFNTTLWYFIYIHYIAVLFFVICRFMYKEGEKSYWHTIYQSFITLNTTPQNPKDSVLHNVSTKTINRS